MSAPSHGHYEAGRGWYDSSLKAWVDKPDRLTPIQKSLRTPSEADRAAVNAWGHRESFAPNPQLERLIQLRDSERTEERQRFEQIAKGTVRMQLHNYEQAKTKAGATDGN